MIRKIKKWVEDEKESVTKAAFYYVICRVLTRGIGFLTTPIFSRLLTHGQYGNVSNFLAWESLLIPIVTLDLRVTINKSKYTYKDNNDSYLLTILLLSNIFTLICYLIIEFGKTAILPFLKMDINSVRILFLYITLNSAFDYQQLQNNIYHRYKKYVVYSIVSVLATALLSVILVLTMEDRYWGRILGIVIPSLVIDVIIYRSIWKRGKKANLSFVKPALLMAIPLIPSAFSSTVLSSSDRTMITSICGSEETALYSIAYSVSGLAAILWSALNTAWGPWLFDHLENEDFITIKKYTNKFVIIYAVLVVGLMLISPEVVYVLGGKSYMSALGVMPPVVLAMVFQFLYTFYFNIEYFYGETYVISIGTFIAAGLNILLNFIFIPKYGYIAAAYTTLVGYFVMMLYHYLIVHLKLKKSYIYNNNFFLVIVLSLCVTQAGIFLVYDLRSVRYTLLLVYLVSLILIFTKYKAQIIGLIKKN